MLKMDLLLFNLFLLSFLGLTGAGQENIKLLHLCDVSNSQVLHAMSLSGYPLAVSVSVEDIVGVSSSVLKAETWLRTHVLAYFPSAKITTIVVGDDLFWQYKHDHSLHMILPSLRNIYYSLTRWGLEREIKISAAFSFNCFDPNSVLSRDDLAEKFTKPLLQFLHATNSTYSLNLSPSFSRLSEETMSLVSVRTEVLEKLGSFQFDKINVIVDNQKQKPQMSRKLITMESKIANPFPERPTPLPETSQPPLHSSIGFSVPANIAKKPQPPQSDASSPPPLSYPHDSPPPFSYPRASPPPFSYPHASPPPFSYPHAPPPPMIFPFAPDQQPSFSFPPTGGPYGYLPPCNPTTTPTAPPPMTGVVQELWCVAKPSVPEEPLQEALDYACGDGGADCAEIMPHGNCFYPNTVVAHASYAFNSYYQKNKRNGGTCSFGGTAMLISSDPSSLHCKFFLS